MIAQVSDDIQAIDPTDRSMPEVRITKPAPTDMIPMIDTWRKMVVRVEKEKKLDEAIENMAISKAKIRIMP